MKSHALRSSLSTYYTYNGNNNSGVNGTSYTFATAPTGTASNNRLVVVMAFVGGNAAAPSLSCTIDGVSANKKVEAATAAGDASALFTLSVSSGTTSSIVISSTQTQTRCGVSVYSLYNLKDPERSNAFVFNPTGSGTDSGDEISSSITLNQRYGGIVLYGSRVFNNLTPPALPTYTWSTSLGDTVTYDEIFRLGGEVNVAAVGSFQAKYTGSNTITLTYDGGVSRNHNTVAAAFY